MRARLWVGSGWILALFLASTAIADEGPFGNLDFSHLSKPQEEFFWRRLKGLAAEEAVLTYCGQPDDFEQQAKQGIRACVTSEALDKAESFFQIRIEGDPRRPSRQEGLVPQKTRGDPGMVGRRNQTRGERRRGCPGRQRNRRAGDRRSGEFASSGHRDQSRRHHHAVNGKAMAGPKELSAKIRALTPGAAVQLGFLPRRRSTDDERQAGGDGV